jgi:hypothetical protein
VSLSFCSGYLRVNLFIIRCFDPDSIALINPLAELVARMAPSNPAVDVSAFLVPTCRDKDEVI